MTVRYITTPATSDSWWWPKDTDYLAKMVHEPEPHAPVKIGLLDAAGTPIYRVEERQPIGFVDWRRA